MRIAMQRHTSIFISRMIEGLTQTQFAALAKLYEVGPCSENYLGRLMFLDAATIKGVVDRLRLRGSVTALPIRRTAAAGRSHSPIAGGEQPRRRSRSRPRSPPRR